MRLLFGCLQWISRDRRQRYERENIYHQKAIASSCTRLTAAVFILYTAKNQIPAKKRVILYFTRKDVEKSVPRFWIVLVVTPHPFLKP